MLAITIIFRIYIPAANDPLYVYYTNAMGTSTDDVFQYIFKGDTTMYRAENYTG